MLGGESELIDSIRQLVVERDSLRSRVGRGGRGRGAGGFVPRAVVGPSNVPSEGLNVSAASGGFRPPFKRSLEETAAGRGSSSRAISFESEQFEVEKRPKRSEDDRTARRSRKLFGDLLGHLRRAKDTLDKEKDTNQAERQKQQEDRVQMKLSMQQKNLAELRKRELEELRNKELMRYEEVQNELSAKETELLRLHLEKHYRTMTNFIRTRAEPTLFWLPYIHTDATRKLQEETKTGIEYKIASLKVHLAAPHVPHPAALSREPSTSEINAPDGLVSSSFGAEEGGVTEDAQVMEEHSPEETKTTNDEEKEEGEMDEESVEMSCPRKVVIFPEVTTSSGSQEEGEEMKAMQTESFSSLDRGGKEEEKEEKEEGGRFVRSSPRKSHTRKTSEDGVFVGEVEGRKLEEIKKCLSSEVEMEKEKEEEKEEKRGRLQSTSSVDSPSSSSQSSYVSSAAERREKSERAENVRGSRDSEEESDGERSGRGGCAEEKEEEESKEMEVEVEGSDSSSVDEEMLRKKVSRGGDEKEDDRALSDSHPGLSRASLYGSREEPKEAANHEEDDKGGVSVVRDVEAEEKIEVELLKSTQSDSTAGRSDSEEEEESIQRNKEKNSFESEDLKKAKEEKERSTVIVADVVMTIKTRESEVSNERTQKKVLDSLPVESEVSSGVSAEKADGDETDDDSQVRVMKSDLGLVGSHVDVLEKTSELAVGKKVERSLLESSSPMDKRVEKVSMENSLMSKGIAKVPLESSSSIGKMFEATPSESSPRLKPEENTTGSTSLRGGRRGGRGQTSPLKLAMNSETSRETERRTLNDEGAQKEESSVSSETTFSETSPTESASFALPKTSAKSQRGASREDSHDGPFYTKDEIGKMKHTELKYACKVDFP